MLHDQPSLASTATIRGDHDAIVASLELSTTKWLVTVHSPGSERLSRHVLEAGDVARLLALFSRLRDRAERRVGGAIEIVTIQEAGLDGFWLHRLLERRNPQPYCRCRFDPGAAPQPTGQERQDRR